MVGPDGQPFIMNPAFLPILPPQYERVMAARVRANLLTMPAPPKKKKAKKVAEGGGAAAESGDVDEEGEEEGGDAEQFTEMVVTLRALTEKDEGSDHLVTTVPVELLSEWAHTALHQKDCAALGRAMTIAAACGHELGAL